MKSYIGLNLFKG